MKMPQKQYEILKRAVNAYRRVYGDDVKVSWVNDINTARRWFFFWRASFDLEHDDNHPLFVEGYRKRVVPYNREFDLSGLNDAHIDTALRRIMQTPPDDGDGVATRGMSSSV